MPEVREFIKDTASRGLKQKRHGVWAEGDGDGRTALLLYTTRGASGFALRLCSTHDTHTRTALQHTHTRCRPAASSPPR